MIHNHEVGGSIPPHATLQAPIQGLFYFHGLYDFYSEILKCIGCLGSSGVRATVQIGRT